MPAWQYSISAVLDRALLRSVGPLIPGALRHSEPARSDREISGSFLIDTGAFGAMIDLEVAGSLELPIVGAREVHGIHGYGTLQQYQARLVLPAQDPSGKSCSYTKVIDCLGIPSLVEKNQEHNVAMIGILGRMFLQFVHLEIDGIDGQLSLRIDDSAG